MKIYEFFCSAFFACVAANVNANPFLVDDAPRDLSSTVKSAADQVALQVALIRKYPDYPTIIFSNATVVPYVASRSSSGVLVVNNEWHGTVVLKSTDGRCLTVLRDKFHLELNQGVQLPQFRSSEIGNACPAIVH